MSKLIIILLIINSVIIYVQTNKSCPEYKYKEHEDRSDILSKIPDTRKIGSLSLTGTRNSMTYLTHDPYKRTQDLNITEQLKYGVRVFDIAVHYEPLELMIYSSMTNYVSVSLRRSLDDFFSELDKFLDDNPREFVIVYINYSYEAGENALNSIKQCQVLGQYATDSNGSDRWVKKWSLNDSIEKYRGKILFATNQYELFDCARMFKYECLNLDTVTLHKEDIDSNYTNATFNHDKKWYAYTKFSTKKRYSFYPCYIYDLSNFGSYSVARSGDFVDFYEMCIEPINYRIENKYPGSHNSTLTMVFVDHVTQGVIDRVNEANMN